MTSFEPLVDARLIQQQTAPPATFASILNAQHLLNMEWLVGDFEIAHVVNFNGQIKQFLALSPLDERMQRWCRSVRHLQQIGDYW